MVISFQSAFIVLSSSETLILERKVETRLIGYTNGIPTDIDVAWHVYSDDVCSGSPQIYAQFDGFM